MSTPVRNITDSKIDTVIAEFNKLRAGIAKIQAGLVYHADATTAVATANGDGTEAKAVALANALKTAFNAHCDSAVSMTTAIGVHMAADAANKVATAAATDIASAITLANAVKAAYNLHCAATAAHMSADSANTVATADANDQASCDTLLNAMKTKINAHFANAMNSSAINITAC